VKRILTLTIIVLSSFLIYSQDNNETLIILKKKDSLSQKENKLKFDWEIRSRSFFMSTLYDNNLKDDYAFASGIGLSALTHSFHGFQFGVAGFFSYNIFSSQIAKPDSQTLAMNRYELGLFDITQPDKKTDIARLEELFLKYKLSKSSITVGKMLLNTPFFNPQDGRMRPTFEEGAWITIAESKKIGFNGGWIWSASPRSTVKWYRLQESIGLYPMGVNENGKKLDYFGNVVTNGMAIANVYFQPSTKFKINLWNGYLDNIMNTGIVEINAKQNVSEKTNLYEGLIYIHQDALNYGGNIDQNKTYFKKGGMSNVISAQVGLKGKVNNTSINYTHITGDGEYLMPREWGKEIFYTFLPRERNEGLGNVHAFVIRSGFSFSQLKTSVGYGYYQLPDVKNYRLNKYGMPSYHQLNYDATYTFGKSLKGLELKILVVYKLLQGNIYNNLKYEYNKVNLVNFNLIIDYKI
jgi:hypothetical protein